MNNIQFTPIYNFKVSFCIRALINLNATWYETFGLFIKRMIQGLNNILKNIFEKFLKN